MVSGVDLGKITYSFVSSCLDYINAVFTCLDKSSISHQQAILNAAARLLTKANKYSHITPVLYSLRFLCSHIELEMARLLTVLQLLPNSLLLVDFVPKC